MLNNILWFAAGFVSCLLLVAALICWACAAISKEMEETEYEQPSAAQSDSKAE